MKVSFIYPDLWSEIKSSAALQPLVIAALAAHTPDNWDISFYDERIESINLDETTDLVVISVMTVTAKRAYNISAHYRARRIPVVMGGFHATILPEEVMEHADSIVTGDMENVWERVLKDAQAGQLQKLYRGGVVAQPRNISFDRSIFMEKSYIPMIPVQFSRGCKYSCDFCSIHSFYGNRVVTRPIDNVLLEIESISQKLLFFVDDNLFAQEQQVLPFLRDLRYMKKLWTCQISVDAAYNHKLLQAMKEAGCLAVYVGFESMDHDNLKAMSKGGNLLYQNYKEVVNRFYQAGLMVCGSFVFGYDGDTEDSVKSTLEFALEEKLALSHFNLLFPYPKTGIYQRLKDQRRLFYEKWWIHEGYRYGDPLFHPEKIDGFILSDLCFKARQSFNSIGSILKRGFDLKANSRNPVHFFCYLLSNMINRREIYKKQGRSLG